MKSLYENLSEPAPLEEGALRVIPLGGLGEVGRNMNVLEYRGNSWSWTVAFSSPKRHSPAST